MIAALAVAAALGASAASTAPAAPPRESPYWLKLYSLQPRRDSWTVGVELKSLDGAGEKVAALVEKNGGRLSQPLSSFPADATQRQLVAVVPAKTSAALLAALKKLGKVDEPVVRPISPAIPAAEAKEKLARLLKERSEQTAAYGSAPVGAAVVDELIAHLSSVVAADKEAVPEVLWNVTLRAKP